MKKIEVKENSKVVDSWWRDWGVGRITEVKKTVFRVNFKYDYPHAQFLEKCK